MRKLVVRAARNGYTYGFDRATGEFLYAKQYVNVVNWTEGIDQKTGLPLSYDPATPVQAYNRGAAPRMGTTATFCPAVPGGKNWMPAAYNPRLEVLYVPATEGCSQNTVVDEHEYPIGVKGGTRKPARSLCRTPGFAGGRDRLSVGTPRLAGDGRRQDRRDLGQGRIRHASVSFSRPPAD